MMNELQNALLFAQSTSGDEPPLIVMLFGMAAMLGVVVAAVAGMWKTFEKAGKPGWAILVPFYNLIVLLEVAGRPAWWLILLLIPCVNLPFAIIVPMDVAKNFGKGAGFGLGLVFLSPIFYAILGFGDAKYHPPVVQQA